MPLVHSNWPGKKWAELIPEAIPQEIQDWYKLTHPVLCAKRTPDDRIVIWFTPKGDEVTCEVWQILDDKWVHVGPRHKR